MMMYCPVCLNNSLHIQSKGVINVLINGKQMDTGRFLFNFKEESLEEITNNFGKKVDEFFSWYQKFENKDPICIVDLLTSDMKCSNDCKFPLNNKFSAVNIMIPTETIRETFLSLAKKYKLEIKLQF